MIKVAIAGAAGRMGCALVRCASRSNDARVAAALECRGHSAIGKDAGLLAGIGEIGVPVSDNDDAARLSDVLIDFSSPESTAGYVRVAPRLGVPMVIGTTGLDETGREEVMKASGKIPIVWAPNMSTGVNLLFSLVRKSAETLGMRYDIEVTETHHRLKKDAPSGTALRLAEEAAAGRGQKLKKAAVYGRRGQTGERPEGQIGIHALRMGDVVGDHTVSFAVEGERLDLSHHATSRDTFAMGALRAAAWVVTRRPGLYDMQDVLGLRA